MSVIEKKISEAVLNVLGDAVCIDNSLVLTGTLDRKLYTDTNKVLESLGGKWNKKSKAHLFDGDAADLVDQVILTGTYSSAKSDCDFFETSLKLSLHLIDLAALKPEMTVLEPSAGHGAIADEVSAKGCHVTCIELFDKNYEVLKATGHKVWNVDFLTQTVLDEQKFDRVIMNPPFSKRRDIHHILHAFKYLKTGGKLVAVASRSVAFRDDKMGRDFREFVAQHNGTITDLPDGSFKDAGTMVSTSVVTMEA